MISTTSITIATTTESPIAQLEKLTLISDNSSVASDTTTSTTNKADTTMTDLLIAIQQLDDEIMPLSTKVRKKLDKVKDEIANCNFLIDSGIGSKKDQAELRKTKRQLRQRRIKLWDELKVLPALKEEKIELERQLKALRRQLGVIDDET